MPLYKNLGGETVQLSPEEEAAVLAEWAANAPAKKRQLTRSQFKELLSLQEMAALSRLMAKVESLSDQDAALLLDFITASVLEFAPAGQEGKFEFGLKRLVALGVLTEDRRKQILGG